MIYNNLLICSDNLEVMKNMTSESIDLIATDPPFNTGKVWRGKAGEFKDKFKDVETFTAWMCERAVEMHRILKPTGSLYLHCDQTASHYLKVMLDKVFGKNNFENEIIWCYAGRAMSKTRFARKHDTILFYGKGPDRYFDVASASRPVDERYVSRYNKVDEEGKRYATIKGKDGKYTNYYLKDVIMQDWWNIPYVRGNEVNGYPTQKPSWLYERIVSVSSKEGDTVLDPFCGSGTTLVAAKNLGRNYVGIDINPDAISVSEERLK